LGEADAYLSNLAYYPAGVFGDCFDGNGDPMHNTPLFRQDLAAPFGSKGSIARLDNVSNLSSPPAAGPFYTSSEEPPGMRLPTTM